MLEVKKLICEDEKMKKSNIKYDGKDWIVESDHTTANITTTWIKDGVARTELLVVEGTPEEVQKKIGNKKHKVLYSWNVKVLSREVLMKNGFVKDRETAVLQAEGLNGEGKPFRMNDPGQSVEAGEEIPNEGIVDNKKEYVKRNLEGAMDWSVAKFWVLVAAGVALCVAIGVTLAKYFQR